MTVVARGSLTAFSNITYHKEIPITLDSLQLSEEEWNEMSEKEREDEVHDYMVRLRNEDIMIDCHLEN